MFETERLLVELARLGPALLFVADSRGMVEFVNERWSEVTGAPANQLLGEGWTKFVHPDDLKRLTPLWQEAVRTGQPYSEQWRFRRVDGTYHWVEIRAEPERNASGEVTRWFGSGADIDMQRRALDALRLISESGAMVGTTQDVPLILNRVAHAALDGMADITFFDLLHDGGEMERLVVSSPGLDQVVASEIAAARPPPPAAGHPHPVSRAIAEGRSVHVPQVDADYIRRATGSERLVRVWQQQGFHSAVVAPLRVPGRTLGAMTLVRTRTPTPFDASDVQVAEEIARRVAVAIENVRLNEIARSERAERERTLQLFSEIGETLSGSLELRPTLDAIVKFIVPEYADSASIRLVDENGEPYVAIAYPTEAKNASRDEGAYLEVPLTVGGTLRGTLGLSRREGKRAFDRGSLPFFRELARRIAPAIVNAELYERERRVAQRFQQAALPARLPAVAGYRFDAIYEAGSAEALIGGDWYDAFSLSDGRVVVSIGDVAGAGLQAAVTMSNVRQAIRGVSHVNADPALMLEAADRTLRADEPDRFVTAFVGVIDPIGATLTYANAGHPPPFLRDPLGKLSKLEASGLPLGLRSADEPQASACEFIPGSLLVLYTDGLVESTRNIDEGERRLEAALGNRTIFDSEHPAKALKNAVLVDGARDDVAILTVRATPRSAPLRWVFDARDPLEAKRVREQVLDHLRKHGYPRERQPTAELILGELTANVYRYAQGPAQAVLEWDEEHPPVIHMIDLGPGFRYSARLPSDIFSETGRGLYLVSNLAADVQVSHRQDGGSHARVVLRD